MIRLLFLTLLFQAISCFADIKAIVFDYGGVVSELRDTSKADKFIQTTFNLTDEELKTTLKELSKSEVSEEMFFQRFAQNRNVNLPSDWLDSLEILMTETSQLNPKVQKIIKALKEKSLRIALFSNIEKLAKNILQEKGHYNDFDLIVCSCDIGFKKPNIASYKILIETLNLKPEEIIFIDDKKINVDAAKTLGIDALHFSTAEKLIEDLKTRKIHIK